MIHDVGADLLTQLQANACPFPVIDGPEFRPTTTFARERIVIEQDMNGGDSFTSRRQADTNPRTWLTRNTGVKLTIYAQCPNKGALYWEHIYRAEHVLDMVLVALSIIAKERKNLVVFKSGKFVLPADLKESETPGGAVYELLFTFDRGVADRTWTGAVLPTTVVSPAMLNAPALTFSASAHTITRDSGSFLSDGFQVGNTVLIAGSASNNGTKGPITILTDNVMTFGSGLTNEGPVSGVTMTGNGVVIQNSSGVSDDVGNTPETV